tara:strand:- start:418 stop:939 length:522 start_codon:yes stop_codon:yes gene_type:complete
MNNKIIINLTGFYICWWVSIYGAIKEIYYLGLLFLFFYMIIHFKYISFHESEYLYIIISFLLGFAIDTVLLNIGLIDYKGFLPEKYNLSPMWAITLWMCFGLSIFHSFQWIQKKYLIAMLLGMVSGPIIYYSCLKGDIIKFNYPLLNVLVIISFLWSIILPLFVYIADYLIDE